MHRALEQFSLPAVSSLSVTVSNILLVFFKLFYLTKILHTYGISSNTQKWGYVIFKCLPFFPNWYIVEPFGAWCNQQNIQAIGWYCWMSIDMKKLQVIWLCDFFSPVGVPISGVTFTMSFSSGQASWPGIRYKQRKIEERLGGRNVFIVPNYFFLVEK